MENTNKVNRKVWKSWGEVGQAIFNQTYEWLVSNQALTIHPKQPPLPGEQWKTIAWNAAWVAADASCGINTVVEP